MSIIASQYITGRKVIVLTHTIVYKDCNIFSAYSLCSHLPFEELTASLASAYTLSVLVAELVVSPGTVGIFFYTILNPTPVASPASTYTLSTKVT